MNFREIFGENVTYDDIKTVTKKQSFALFFKQYIFWNIFLGFKHRFFLNETSILVFAKLATFHSI